MAAGAIIGGGLLGGRRIIKKGFQAKEASERQAHFLKLEGRLRADDQRDETNELIGAQRARSRAPETLR
jgi:hypothetical protein